MPAFPFPRPKITLHLACMKRAVFTHKVETLSDWTLLMSESGSFSFKIGQKVGQSSPGSYVICPPGIPFHRKVLHGPISFHYLLFRWAGNTTLPGGQYHLQDLDRQRGILNALRQLSTRSGEPGAGTWAACFLEELLRQPLFESTFFPKTNPGYRDRLMEKVEVSLSQNLRDPPSLSTLAHQLRITPSRLTQRFSRVYGVPPRQWIIRQRIALARRLLVESDWKLEQIADASGFCDAFHLGRVFKKNTGTSPGQFRRERQV